MKQLYWLWENEEAKYIFANEKVIHQFRSIYMKDKELKDFKGMKCRTSIHSSKVRLLTDLEYVTYKLLGYLDINE
jgi:hypothetical protein